MLDIKVIYASTTRQLSLPPGSDLYGGATIDSNSVQITVYGIDNSAFTSNLTAYLDFAINIMTAEHIYTRPAIPLTKGVDEEDVPVWSAVVPTDVLAATSEYKKLPFQLVLRDGDTVINSRNTIVLTTTRAIDAAGTSAEMYKPYVMFRNDTWAWEENFTYKRGAVVSYGSNVYVSLSDDNLGHNPQETLGTYWGSSTAVPDGTIVSVEYDEPTATLTFTRLDGGTLEVSFPDLKYDLFRVATEADLPSIQGAQNGDMAVTNAGVWYVYYNDGTNRPVWNQMSSPTTLNGSQTTTPAFYAPLSGGVADSAQYLTSDGTGNAPVWETKVTTLDDSSALPTSGAVKTAIDAVAENLQVETPNRALVSDANNRIIASDITTTELNTLDGVDTSTTIQTQLTALDTAIGDEATARGLADEALDGRLDTLESYIPDGTSSSNKLTNKLYVDNADTALDARLDVIEARMPPDSEPINDSTKFITSDAVYEALEKKQSSMAARAGLRIIPEGESIEGKLVDVIEHTNAITVPSNPGYVVIGDKATVPIIWYDAQGHLITGTSSISIEITEGQVTNLTTDLGNITTDISGLQSGKVDKTTTVNGHALSSDVTITKSDVGLGRVDNTNDLEKPISTATQTALDAKLDDSQLITAWDTPTDAQIASAKLTKDSLDDKMDDSQLVTAWQTVPDNTHVPSEYLVKTYIDDVASNLNVQTGNMVLVSDANRKIVASSSITVAELNTLDGITTSGGSTIQSQLNSKVDANSAITGATKCKITYDSKGLVTGGADLEAGDIPTLDISKISGLQSALNGKAPTNHRSTANTYGLGDDTYYGHVKMVQTIPTSKPSGTPDPEADYTVTAAGIRDFVNSSISTGTGAFLGTVDVVDDLGLTTSATNAQIQTALASYAPFASATNSDYCFVTVNTIPSTPAKDEYRRFKYVDSTTSWLYEYTLNNSSFTQDQWAAINSGITDQKVTKLDGIETGAEVNVQADWTEADTSSDAYIKHKPTTIAEAGITDAKITTETAGTTITLGSQTVVPITGVSSGTAVADKYISALSVSGNSITVTRADLPSLSGGASAVSGKYVSAVEVSGHAVTVAQENLPELSKGATSGPGNAVTDITVSGHQITLTKDKTFLETHQTVTDKDVTQAWGTRQIIATIGSTDIHLTAMADPFSHNTVTLDERVYS